VPTNTPRPATCAPRLLRRLNAAEYLALGPTLFDEMVADGRLPKPRQVSAGRVAWDVRELDAAVDDMPKVGEGPGASNTWGDFLK
jgi:predicted DNA-binding transcriptional regulator AlpA